MAETSFSKLGETQDFRNESVNYIAEIRQMMHGFGDSSEPLLESAKIVEEVVLHQMRSIVNKACEVAERRGQEVASAEDFIFLLRKDKVKLHRLLKYLSLKEFRTSMNKILTPEDDTPEQIVDFDLSENPKTNKQPYHKFLSRIDNTGALLDTKSIVDHVKQNRCLRAEMMTRKMDDLRYLEFSKARRISFANKNRHKFSDWVSQDGDIGISKTGYMVLGYLAYETVAQIVDLGLLVRHDQTKLYGDSIDRLTLGYLNPYTFKPYLHNKGIATKPITPAEINEALRRYWSPQLDMTGPFHRSSTRKPYLKLLSC